MITLWTQHLDSEEDKERFRKTVLSSKTALDRLDDILDIRMSEINTMETGAEIYSKPGWDALLAHYNGEKSALKSIKRIINLDHKETQ